MKLEFDPNLIAKESKRNCWSHAKICDVYEAGFLDGAMAQHHKDLAAYNRLLEIAKEMKKALVRIYQMENVKTASGSTREAVSIDYQSEARQALELAKEIE